MSELDRLTDDERDFMLATLPGIILYGVGTLVLTIALIVWCVVEGAQP